MGRFNDDDSVDNEDGGWLGANDVCHHGFPFDEDCAACDAEDVAEDRQAKEQKPAARPPEGEKT